jgi:hypothetical protein
MLAALTGGTLLANQGDRPRLIPGTERPGGSLSNPLDQARDLSGRSVKTRRVRAIHSLDDRLPGTTGWLVKHDPWLAYQRGRELTLREFSVGEGAFGEAGKLAGKSLDDQCTRMGTRDEVNNCATCHNTPWRDMGMGAIIAKNGGNGRRTPHLFGGGEIEMIGEDIRRQLLSEADHDHQGWISRSEARGAAQVQSSPGHVLSFGSFAIGPNGRPALNSIVYVWYVDRDGHRIPWARSMQDEGVAGYNFKVDVFGFGQRDQVGQGGLGSTLRAVTANAWDVHSGLQACDPTMNEEPRRDGLARVSLAGAQQFYTGATRDVGEVMGSDGVSLEDPDRDGVPEEISEGDLDLAEFYLLNHPAPAERHSTAFARGLAIARQVGCLSCHTPDWRLPEDRRFFHLDVAERHSELEGTLRPTQPGPFTVHGVYSDFRQHDLGLAFHQMQYDGSTLTHFRTTPLWGVGSQNCFGHDGASLDLDSVIRRHGGEAAQVTARYERLSDRGRDDLVDFLRGLVVYDTETLPTDLRADGKIANHFVVAGVDTGREVFNPEWLFRHPVRIEGWVTAPDGRRILSRAATNLDAAYGVHLPGLQCISGTGFPDALQRTAVQGSAP